jgi:AcrR family transcriptional regulator
MVPQARSETTRQKILNAAIDLFSQVGYAAAGLGEIIERAGMTKGALYHHFDSKETLATAIIEQGTQLTHDAFRHVCESSSPALENMIHGAFVVTDLLVSDKTARTAEQLTRGLAEFNSAASQVWSSRLDTMMTQASRASTEGDLREDIDPYVVSESILNAMLGAQLLSTTTGSNDHIKRLTRPLELLLPAIVADTSLAYFREFLARESLRQAHQAADPTDLSKHTGGTNAHQPTVARSNSRTSPPQSGHRGASATCSSWPAPSNPHNAAAPRPGSPAHRR